MIKSMTGFGNAQTVDKEYGKINLEIKSSNHRFLESIVSLPSGFMHIEDRLKKKIARKIRRGRVLANFAFAQQPGARVLIDQNTIMNYVRSLEKLRKKLSIRAELNLDTLLQLPQAVTFQVGNKAGKRVQTVLLKLLDIAVNRLESDRRRAGQAIYRDLNKRSTKLLMRVKSIKSMARIAIHKKSAGFSNAEEKSAFLKSADINEELTLLKFHINNFRLKLNLNAAVGKQLDFVAQEMQREANTLAAKSFDARILSEAIEMKTQIEKIREQLQNVE